MRKYVYQLEYSKRERLRNWECLRRLRDERYLFLAGISGRKRIFTRTLNPWLDFSSARMYVYKLLQLYGSNSCRSIENSLHLRTSNGGKYLLKEGKLVVALSSEKAASGNHKWLIKLRLSSASLLLRRLWVRLFIRRVCKGFPPYQRSDSSSSR